MKFSEAWLREWVNPPADTEELGHRLTMAGLELDSLDPASTSLDGVVVARIVKAEPHPDADRLQVCQVDLGQGNLTQVVCGAANARVDLVAPFATPGTTLPNGTKIASAQLRGVESNGMLCSVSELGLDEAANGLLELDSNLVPGISIAEALTLDDYIFDVDLTPNRADCLSIKGVAREVATLYNIPTSEGSDRHVLAVEIEDTFPIQVDAVEACPRYCGRIIRGVRADAMTPMWMRERLRRAGVRAIHPIVDVTNYVMLELGQPMHAFDLALLNDGIEVRYANEGESLELLDGQTVELKSDSLVIADKNRAIALAGIMGGMQTAVQDQTVDLFLESAFFSPQAIAGKARVYGLHTDSSHRFERGVDPSLALIAIDRASQLIQEIAGGSLGPVVDKRDELSSYWTAREIALSNAKIEQLLGMSIPFSESVDILRRLGCEVERRGEVTALVTPPSFRFDLQYEVDLIEEIVRIRGYENLPHVPMAASSRQMSISKTPVTARLANALVGLGYHEAVTFSFVENASNRYFDSVNQAKPVANPISNDLEVMRTSLWPGLCAAAAFNLNRQQNHVRLFEVGNKYVPRAGGVDQETVIAGIAIGERVVKNWQSDRRLTDFFDLKGDLEAIFDPYVDSKELKVQMQEVEGLHPGKTAAFSIGDESLGTMGELHPSVAKQYGFSQPAYVFELRCSATVWDKAEPEFAAWSKYPYVRRDIALLVPDSLSVQELIDGIDSLGLDELQRIELFDVYEAEDLGEGQKSVALGLILQDFSSTLTDKKIEQVLDRIISHASEAFGAQLRNT